MAVPLLIQDRDIDALTMLEPLLKKMSRVLPLDDPLTLKTMVGVAITLGHLERYDEGLKMYEDVLPRLIRVSGEDHEDTLMAMAGMAAAQLILHCDEDAKQTATRGLLIARRVGNEERAARFAHRLSA
jgi:hypothetical protein